MPKKCPNTEFFLLCIFPYSVQIQENTDQKKPRMLFIQCYYLSFCCKVFLFRKRIKYCFSYLQSLMHKEITSSPYHISVTPLNLSNSNSNFL